MNSSQSHGVTFVTPAGSRRGVPLSLGAAIAIGAASPCPTRKVQR